MRGFKFHPRNIALALALCGAVVCARGQTPVPAEAFAVLPDKAPAISPDGTHFALIREQNGRPDVTIYDLGSGPIKRVSPTAIL